MATGDIPELKKQATISYLFLGWILVVTNVGTFTVTKFYDSTTRIEDRLNKKTDRLQKEIQDKIDDAKREEALQVRIQFLEHQLKVCQNER